MTSSLKETQTKMLHEQVKMYAQLFPQYSLYAETLVKIFERSSKKYAPQAIVQARPKAIASFAEKILRKNKYKDPVNQITDLCGVRVITHIPDEVKAICEFIEKNFIIDWENSLDVSKRLKTSEFGYRSVHYIIQFKDDIFPNKDVAVDIPKEVFGLKAEVQVRTILEHSWADFSHDMSYKGAFKIPQKWERELSGLAASLESVDNSFSRIHSGLQSYAGSYGAYMSKEQMQDEMNLQELILANDQENVEVAHRIGKLALVMGDWQKAVDVASKYVKSDYLPLLRDLGVALCKKHKGDKKSSEYVQGQKYLEIASAPPNKDVDALSSLAGTYKEVDEAKARELYRQAFEIDPTNPYCVGNYIESEIILRKDASAVPMISATIETAIKRSRDQIEVGINLPWAFYDLGKFYLLTGKPLLSLGAYAKGVQISMNNWMIENTLHSINRLSLVRDQLPGYDWIQKLLLIALASKFPETDAGKAALKEMHKLKTTGYKQFQASIIIVAGGCDSEIEDQMQTYRYLVLEALRDFKGTAISGGTTSGISGLIGEAQQKYADKIMTIGYLPKSNKSASIDKRYTEIRFVEGKHFSPSEPLQYWIDIVASRIDPSNVKLLGINGGSISAIEYRLALAFGAQVALVQGSGREATKLLSDSDWKTSDKLLSLPGEPMTVWAFVESGTQKLEPNSREQIAKVIHESYRAEQLAERQSKDPSLAEWANLVEGLKESNRQQADHIFKKLPRIGCATRLVDNRKVALMTFTDAEVELLAEEEHARWNVERLQDGWKLGDKDVTKKISPYIVSWSELPDKVKEWDRKAVRKIPEFLSQVNTEVYRLR
jgi:ppGpp synthetase/RelA/SpoT-type nucleotidyltranferase